MVKWIKLLPLILVVLVFNLLIGCEGNTTTTDKDVREIVWEQLSEGERNEIIGDWKDGTIEKITADKDSNQFSLDEENLDGKEVYLVTFESENEPTIGNIQKLVDMKVIKL